MISPGKSLARCALCLLPAAFALATFAQLAHSDAAAKGQRLFQTHCAFCHGPNGEGGKGPTLAQPTLPRASDDASLLKIITDGISGTEMPRSRLSAREINLVSTFVKSLGQMPAKRVPGDPVRGAQFYATKGACATCHALDGRGHGRGIGPELSVIGRRRSAAYLRRALLEPGAEVPQSFSAYRSDVNLPEAFFSCASSRATASRSPECA